jgi:hypothetical protein
MPLDEVDCSLEDVEQLQNNEIASSKQTVIFDFAKDFIEGKSMHLT